MKSIRLALSYVRIPKLFLSLFFFPLILSLIVVFAQIYVTGLYIQNNKRDLGTMKNRLERMKENNPARLIIYGSLEEISPLRVCYWTKQADPDGKVVELPPPGCEPDRLDVAIRPQALTSASLESYTRLFDGAVERIHICESCSPDIIIRPDELETVTELKSIQGLLVLTLTNLNEGITEQYLSVAEEFDSIQSLLGVRRLYADGFEKPIKISGVYSDAALLMSVATLVIIALWLAVKAHRKVLDYFARSGALLPMVAAIGKREFYSAIWILTLMRVGAFLVAAVPLLIVSIVSLEQTENLQEIFSNDWGTLAVWLVALVASFSLASVIASVADLQHRHHLFSFAYKFLPLILCLFGLLLWGVSFFFVGSGSGVFRSVLSAMPVLGTGPVLIAPIFSPPLGVLVFHGILTTLLVVMILRKNSQWFAAHLEDL